MSTESSNNQGNSSGAGASNGQKPANAREVTLLDVAYILTRSRKMILQVTAVFLVLGIGYVIVTPNEYVSTTKVARESQEESGPVPAAGLSALQGLGINLGAAGGGLSVSAFPQVLQSREVLLAVARDTIQVGGDLSTSYIDYIDRPPRLRDRVLDYSLYLPWTLRRMLSTESPEGKVKGGGQDTLARISDVEQKAIEKLNAMLFSTIDEESGLMLISVTSQSPDLSASLAESFLTQFSRRVRAIRTKRSRERLSFVEDRLREAAQKLEEAEDELANFLERNQNPTTAGLRFQKDRFERQVRFKEELYSTLQTRVSQTRLDVQRRHPVLTVVEQPVVPLRRSSPRLSLTLIFCTVLGALVGAGTAIMQAVFSNSGWTSSRSEMMYSIETAFSPSNIVRRARGIWRSKGDQHAEDY